MNTTSSASWRAPTATAGKKFVTASSTPSSKSSAPQTLMAMYQQAPGSKRKVITTHHDGIPIAFLIAREQALAQATQDRIDKRPIAGYRAFGRPQLAITPKKAPPPRQEPEGDDESDDDFEISMAPPPRR